MTKQTCSIIGLIVVIVAALAFLCVPVLQTDWMGGIHIMDTRLDSAAFACFAYGVSVVLMIIGCICVYTDNVKATNVLFSIASVLPVIAVLALVGEIMDTSILKHKSETYIGTLAVFSFIQIAVLICYHSAKNPEKVKVTAQNVEVTDEDRRKYAAQVAGSSIYDLRVYAYDKRGVYEPALAVLALEEICEREAGRRRRLTGEEIQRQEEERQKAQEEYVEVLSQKSDEELKELIRDEKMYEASFVGAAREELQARVLGKRRQKTAEEIQWEQLRREEEQRKEEEQRRLEEERLQKEKEVQLQKERKEEQYKTNENTAKVLFVVVIFLAVGLIVYSLTK